jgi:hypothetical protein
MKLIGVKSKFIKAVAYDELTKHMRVLIGSKFYNHFEVPQDIYDALMASESKGAYYNKFIRGNFV